MDYAPPSHLLRIADETSRPRKFLRFVNNLERANGWLASHRQRPI